MNFRTCWESFIIRLDILIPAHLHLRGELRIFHYSPWYTYWWWLATTWLVENLSLFALIYLMSWCGCFFGSWESFIIRLDILSAPVLEWRAWLRIFHYSPWYTYQLKMSPIILSWESFIIRLDILMRVLFLFIDELRIFHYSPWYTYVASIPCGKTVENLSLFALIYLLRWDWSQSLRWESFIIRLDILRGDILTARYRLRIFHYSPWYTYQRNPSAPAWVENLSLFALIYLYPKCWSYSLGWESFIIRLDILIPWARQPPRVVENLSLFALIYLSRIPFSTLRSWESFIIRLDILTGPVGGVTVRLRIFHYSPWYT